MTMQTMTIEGCEVEYPRGKARTVRRLFASTDGGTWVPEATVVKCFPEKIDSHRGQPLHVALSWVGARILSEPS